MSQTERSCNLIFEDYQPCNFCGFYKHSLPSKHVAHMISMTKGTMPVHTFTTPSYIHSIKKSACIEIALGYLQPTPTEAIKNELRV